MAGWGLLEATQDHGAFYSTPEEFERKNLQWSLTPKGEAGISGLLHALDSLRHAVGLQPAVLDAIGDGLNDLADILDQPSTDALDARIHLRLAEVEGHHSSLLVSVRQFNGHLQRLLREEAADDSVFADVKAKTVSYLKEYVDGVEGPQQRLAVAIERLAEAGVATLFDRALRGANLAPVAGGDPAPSWLERRLQHWEALRAWFAPTDAGAAPDRRAARHRPERHHRAAAGPRTTVGQQAAIGVGGQRLPRGWPGGSPAASGDDEAQALFSRRIRAVAGPPRPSPPPRR